MKRLRAWFPALSNRRIETDMDDEMRYHMENYAEDLMRRGVAPEEARRRACAEFGPIEARKDECRDALGLRLISELRSDLRYAARMLRKSPAFTTVAILSLGLGIGANTAIFSLMETALWKSIPVSHPEQMRLLSWTSGPKAVMDSSWGSMNGDASRVTSPIFSYPTFLALQRANRSFESLFAFKDVGRITAVVDAQAELVRCELASGSFYRSVGISTIAGRPITPADDVRGGPIVAVISYGYWERRFGRDAAVIGKRVDLNHVPVTIVGVNPPAFEGVEAGERPDLFAPLASQPVVAPNEWATKGALLDDPDYWWLQILGRLKPGVNDREAQAAMEIAFTQAVRSELPDRLKRDQPHLRLLSGERGLDELRDEFSKPLFVLVAFVGLVLLIACANIANLLLARSTSRQREIGMRLALGAGRWRIARQMLTEGLLLATAGGVCGILLGYLMRDAIPGLMTAAWRPPNLQSAFDPRVVVLSLAVTMLTGVLFSLAPMWQAGRVELSASLKEGSRSSMSLPKLLAGKALVVFQVALCVLLLVGAGLFVRTLSNLKSARLGFNPERILLFTIDPPRTRYAGASRIALFQRIEREVASAPGIRSSTLASEALVADSSSTTRIIPDWRTNSLGEQDRAWVHNVGDRYFETMGIPILHGRAIGPADVANSQLVTVVNQQFVRKFFPKGDALGRNIHNGKQDFRIVGICGDARYNKIQADVPPTFYRPFKQVADLASMTFAVKTAASESSVIGAIRERVRSVEKDLPVFDIRTETQQIDATVWPERLFAWLCSAFGILALALASIGVYGIMAYSVARRTGEIGVRLALGAQGRQVLLMVVREGFVLACIGLVVGAGAALALTRFLRAILYQLKPTDPTTFVSAMALMLAVALLAGWWPARRASRLDPMAALRHE